MFCLTGSRVYFVQGVDGIKGKTTASSRDDAATNIAARNKITSRAEIEKFKETAIVGEIEDSLKKLKPLNQKENGHSPEQLSFFKNVHHGVVIIRAERE